MNQISTVNGLSVNAVQNAELKRNYDKHINKIMAISQKKSSVKLISEQQKKISEILKKSKEMSKHFKDKQFMVKCEAENKRLLKSLSTINTRQRIKTDREQGQNPHRLRMKTSCKEKVMREFEIEMQNKKLAQNIMENVCDVQDYRKKMKKQINEYVRLKTQLQRLKPVHFQKITPSQEIHSSIKLKLKTIQNQAERTDGSEREKDRSKTTATRQKMQN